MTEYDDPEHLQFIQDMEVAGFEIFHHQGPFFWQGPAVPAGDPADVLSQTEVLCQWQYVAPGYIVYPVQGMESPDPDKHRHIKPTEIV